MRQLLIIHWSQVEVVGSIPCATLPNGLVRARAATARQTRHRRLIPAIITARMALPAGTRLGPYQITTLLGAGGMGEVYRARDTRLDRSVALKILHSHLSSCADFRSRFEREARTISSLNHPHICHLYDVGSHNGVEFLVMELVEGETLADRLVRGALPSAQVLTIGIEIADALTKAHRLGVVHRDLKPSNVMLTKEGAKLMDFGLAKPVMAGGVLTRADDGCSPTKALTVESPGSPVTSVGTIVGTIHYMSPEQLQGKEADARSDIFALGAMLYEMTTGRPAFTGKSPLSVASAILDSEPESASAVHPGVSPALDYVVRTCLAKDPDERFQTAHDVKLQLRCLLQSAASANPSSIAGKPRASRTAWRIGLPAVLLLAACLAVLLLRSRPAAPQYGPVRFSVSLPRGQELAVDTTQAMALSPDGSRLAYVASSNGVAHLYVRRLDQFDPVEISDSEGATFPFFSPGGDWVAFFRQGKLEKVPSAGGSSVSICDAPSFIGGAWMPDDDIILAVPGLGLYRVPASGGSPVLLKIAGNGRYSPTRPILFSNEWITFTDYAAANPRILALRVDSGEVRELLRNAQGGYATNDDSLVYYSGGAIWAIGLDAKNVSVHGSPAQVISGVSEQNQTSQLSDSRTGVLAYAPGSVGNYSRNIFMVTRGGAETKVDIPPDDYVDPAISPDGKRIAITIRRVGDQELAVIETERATIMRIVANGGRNAAPVWTPDGTSLLYDSAAPSQKTGIYRVKVDDSSPPQLLHEISVNTHVTSIAQGRAALMANDPVTSTDLWLLSLTGNFAMQPLRRTPAMERQGSLSPNGELIAYASNETGISEIYVESVSGAGSRWQISTQGGGEQPKWARNGREIFYRRGTQMMAVPVQLLPRFAAAKPIALFQAKFDRGGAVGGYDVSPDGQTFVMTRSEQANPTEIRILLGWPEQIRSQH